MNLTKGMVLEIQRWTATNLRAREDYYARPITSDCAAKRCDEPAIGDRPHCKEHAHQWDRLRQRVLGEPRSW